MNTSKFTILTAALLATSPLMAAMNGSSPSTTAGTTVNVPAPQATPTAPTSVGPNGAMHTGNSPTTTSATPTAPATSGLTPPTAAQAMGPAAPNASANVNVNNSNDPASTVPPQPAENAQ